MTHNDDPIISRLNSTAMRLAVLIIAFSAQVPHAVHVFANGATCAEWSCYFHPKMFPNLSAGIALEGCILFVLFSGWHSMSYMFALMSVAINVAFYALGHSGDALALTWIEWLKSAIIPGVIATYSHLLVDAPVPAKSTKSSALVQRLRNVYARAVQYATVNTAHTEIVSPILPLLQPVAEDMQPSQVTSENAQSPLQEIAQDAKALYLQLRKKGIAHAEAVRQSGAKNTNTAAAWWRRANMQTQGGD